MDTLVDMSTCEVQQLAEGVQYRFACNSRDKLVKHMLHRCSQVIIIQLFAAVCCLCDDVGGGGEDGDGGRSWWS